MSEKRITIIVDREIDYAISDILCWLEGYISGAKEGYDTLLSPAIEKVRKLNIELKEKLSAEEVIESRGIK